MKKGNWVNNFLRGMMVVTALALGVMSLSSGAKANHSLTGECWPISRVLSHNAGKITGLYIMDKAEGMAFQKITVLGLGKAPWTWDYDQVVVFKTIYPQLVFWSFLKEGCSNEHSVVGDNPVMFRFQEQWVSDHGGYTEVGRFADGE